MKTIKIFLIKSGLFIFMFCFGLIISYKIILARGGTNNLTASSGDKLSADKWNTLISQVNNLSGLQSQINTINSKLIFTGTKSQNGYQILPSGLIIQRGFHLSTSAADTVTLPYTFPNSGLNVIATDQGNARTPYGAQFASNSAIKMRYPGTSYGAYWIAIGY